MTTNNTNSFVNRLKHAKEIDAAVDVKITHLLASVLSRSREEFMRLTPEQLSQLYTEFEQTLPEYTGLMNGIPEDSEIEDTPFIVPEHDMQEKNTTLASQSTESFFSGSMSSDKARIEKVKTFLTSNDGIQKILFLVDDTVSHLKILSQVVKKAITQKNTCTKTPANINSLYWEREQVETEALDAWGIIYAANGDIALKLLNLASHYNTIAVITDHDMPKGILQGTDLIEKITENYPQIEYVALHTSNELNSFSAEQQALIQRAPTRWFILKNDNTKIIEFIKQITNEPKATPQNGANP